MTEFEIDRLEKSINTKLPDWYKEFLLNYPEDLVGLGAPYNTVSELSLPNQTDRLIEISDYEDSPDNILIIGIDGIGNFYYVILDNNDTRIYLFDHEAPSFIDNNEDMIDWGNSYDLVFENLNELISHLKENLTEDELDDSNTAGIEYLQPSEVVVLIECEMKDEWQNNRNLEVADSYPYSINNSEVIKLLKVESTLFEGYPEDYTISYSYLVSVDKFGEIIDADFLGGDNMRITDDVNENIKNLKFEAGTRNNIPVDSYTIVRYNFKMK
ncbi:SMI1/KNR4 family protein [Persicobacter diffluens]|uniref:Knr4/Smi1-like domain-containing protein n=1 Tax=Persicobacter diffluens TaxID=981 RepID=A0AAN4VZ07_9BACT|nr:hypothetical protein PEDI_32130 [Persicobacter diffluens]